MFAKQKSIRIELLTVFLGLLLLMVGTIAVLNVAFSDDFYVAINKQQIKTEVDRIIEKKGDLLKSTDLLNINGGNGIMYDLNETMNEFEPDQFFSLGKYELETLISLANDKGSAFAEFNGMLVYGRIYEDKLITIIKPLGLADEVEHIFTEFLLIILLLILLISIPIVSLLSRWLTKPLVDLSAVTGKIAELDFSNKLDSDRTDEIGVLVRNVDMMSGELSKTVNELNDTNKCLVAELNKERSIDRMRRRFVSDVSHELKNPIAMIIAYADGLRNGIAKADEDKAYYLNVILDEGDKMTRILKDLLELSTYQSGAFAIEREEFSVSGLISDIAERQEHLHADVNAKLTVYNDDNTVFFKGDRLRIGEV